MRPPIFFLAALLSLLACSGGGSGLDPDGGFDAGSDRALDAGADAGPADAGTDAGVSLPVITDATVVTHGTIRVRWTNPTPLCTALTLMRAKDGAAAAVASQPAVTAVEVSDSPGHSSGTFCYSLVCGAQGTSNTKCAQQ